MTFMNPMMIFQCNGVSCSSIGSNSGIGSKEFCLLFEFTIKIKKEIRPMEFNFEFFHQIIFSLNFDSPHLKRFSNFRSGNLAYFSELYKRLFFEIILNYSIELKFINVKQNYI